LIRKGIKKVKKATIVFGIIAISSASAIIASNHTTTCTQMNTENTEVINETENCANKKQSLFLNIANENGRISNERQSYSVFL
jgi:hypothetical protein